MKIFDLFVFVLIILLIAAILECNNDDASGT